MEKILILGYGNPDRQDDGVAWHILAGLAAKLGRKIPNYPDENFEPEGNSPDLWFSLQLFPEMAEQIGEYDRVCFVDAHTGSIPKPLNIASLSPGFVNSPLTHHMTPPTCLALTDSLYHKQPSSILVSVLGYEFKFTRELSEPTANLVDKAIEYIWSWINHP
jgi:hydrogenase maturation protease